jgi:hypothetical protein
MHAASSLGGAFRSLRFGKCHDCLLQILTS